MKKYFFILFIFISLSVWCENKVYKNLNNNEISELKKAINGVWDYSKSFPRIGNIMLKFSWGYSQASVSVSSYFDLDNYEFYDSCFSNKILKIEKMNDNKFKILLQFPKIGIPRENKGQTGELIIILVEENIIKLEGVTGCGDEKNQKYYRISAPGNFVYYKLSKKTILYKKPSLESEKINILNQKMQIRLLETKENFIPENKNKEHEGSIWVKITTKDGTHGWILISKFNQISEPILKKSSTDFN